MPDLFTDIWRSLVDLLLPPVCLACRKPLSSGRPPLLCPECESLTTLVTGPLCSCCGKPFPKATGSDHLCGLCLTGSYHFDSARAIVIYQDPVTTFIHNFKYRGETASLSTFRYLLEQLPHLTAMATATDLIIPVPLHDKKLRRRGFNQAVLLARTFFPEQRQKIVLQNLIRIRHTEPQTSLSGKARRKNLKNAFQVKSPELVQGKNVLLIDDVFTTGTTASECAMILKRAGAVTVRVMTLARVE